MLGTVFVFFLLELTLVQALSHWKAPKSILIQCGNTNCDIWTEYCHHMACMPCNPNVCNLVLAPGGKPSQCYFYCMDVKETMQMAVLEDGISSTQQSTDPTTPVHKIPPDDQCDSANVTPNTIVMVVVPVVTFVAGIGIGQIFYRCNKKRNETSSNDYMNNTPPKGRHFGTSDPQDAVELAISNKLLDNGDHHT